MRCPNCGYEIDKPNKKSCPLCGHKITREEMLIVETASQKVVEDVAVNAEEMQPQEPTAPQSSEAALAMVECPRCYRSVLADANFCPYCGCDMRKPKADAQYIDMYVQQVQPPTQPVPNIQIASAEVSMADEDTQTPSDDVIEEDVSDGSISTNIREENWDEYIDNGSYIPYEEEEESIEEVPQKIGLASWLIIGIASIVGILLGILLYYLCT